MTHSITAEDLEKEVPPEEELDKHIPPRPQLLGEPPVE
jgi:hypothetical protein